MPISPFVLPASLYATLLLGAVACSSCGAGHSDDALPKGLESARSQLTRSRTPSSANVGSLGSNNRAFAFDLLHAIASDKPGENLLFSPYSVSSALAMTYEGARGTTASEMQTSLHFVLERPALHEAFNATDLALASRGTGAAGADGTPFRLLVNNAFWMQRDFSVVPAFLDVLALNYGAGIYLADFAGDPEAARSAINGWVSEQTEKLIPELLPENSIDAKTPLVLTNTVYFNASWLTKFEPESTYAAPFSKLDGTSVTAQLMNAGLQIPYAEGPGWRAIALPYASQELSLIAILPDQGSYDSIETAIDESWFDALQASAKPTSVAVSFPKLDHTSKASLKPELKKLGMIAPFQAGADFSGMSPADLTIDDVIHQAAIKVVEGGTIAAAATAVTFRHLSVETHDETIAFDRPFLFAILDQPTGSLLFVGRVLDPSAK